MKKVFVHLSLFCFFSCDAQTKEEKVYDYVSEMPEYENGTAALYKKLINELNIPSYAPDSGFTGTYHIEFAVEKNGSVSGVKIAKGKTECVTCDAEVMRAIRTLENFQPGKKDGVPVRVRYHLPLHICIK